MIDYENLCEEGYLSITSENGHTLSYLSEKRSIVIAYAHSLMAYSKSSRKNWESNAHY